MKISRKKLRRLINEVTQDACTWNSLGWIDPQGTFHDITIYMEMHDEWMDAYQAVKLGNYDWNRGDKPPRWIKVSNSKELWFVGSWDSLTWSQFKGMCTMWSACLKFSPWLQTAVETTQVKFGSLTTGESVQYTIPDFINQYVGDHGIHYFYNVLLNS